MCEAHDIMELREEKEVHKFLRSIGFSDIRRRDLEMITKDIIKEPDTVKITKDSEGNEFAELTTEFAPNAGITVCGTYGEDDSFEMDYYYPLLNGTSLTTQECIDIEKAILDCPEKNRKRANKQGDKL